VSATRIGYARCSTDEQDLTAQRTLLRGLGVAEARLVLLPSRTWGMPLAPPARRAWFAAARKYGPPGADGRPAAVVARLGLGDLQDLSAGRWRAVVPGAAAEAADVVHERCKYRARDARGGAYAVRYAGLGRWGEAAAARAAGLAAAGIGPEVVAYAGGFLVQRWVEGRPVAGAEVPVRRLAPADEPPPRKVGRLGRVFNRVRGRG